MTTWKKVFEDLLELAGIRVNGPNPWDIRAHDDRFYARALNEKNVGMGESYMDGGIASDWMNFFIG